MKYLSLVVLLFSASAMAKELTLLNGQEYVVPDGRVWIVEDAPMADCRVCTEDLYVVAEMSQVQMAGVVFNGTFAISFSSGVNGPIKLLPGTTVWVGDSRQSIRVVEQTN